MAKLRIRKKNGKVFFSLVRLTTALNCLGADPPTIQQVSSNNPFELTMDWSSTVTNVEFYLIQYTSTNTNIDMVTSLVSTDDNNPASSITLSADDGIESNTQYDVCVSLQTNQRFPVSSDKRVKSDFSCAKIYTSE